MNKRNVATYCNGEFSAATVARYGLLKNALSCACASLDLTVFQLTKNSKNLTFSVSSECELKP